MKFKKMFLQNPAKRRYDVNNPNKLSLDNKNRAESPVSRFERVIFYCILGIYHLIYYDIQKYIYTFKFLSIKDYRNIIFDQKLCKHFSLNITNI